MQVTLSSLEEEWDQIIMDMSQVPKILQNVIFQTGFTPLLSKGREGENSVAR